MKRAAPKRCIHLRGDTMTACGKIVMGSMKSKRPADWLRTLPDWRCPKCMAWAQGQSKGAA